MNTNNYLEQAINIVKGFGYKCYTKVYKYKNYNTDEINYCYITDGTNISYMDCKGKYCPLHFGTIVKRGSRCAIYNDDNCRSRDFFLEDIDEELIKRTFNTPFWYLKESRDEVIIKYKSWEEFVKEDSKFGGEMIEL